MKRILPALGAVVAVAAGAAWYWPHAAGPAELRLPGTVERHESRLGSRYGGRVAAVHARDGQPVEPGQVLVRFEADEAAARRDQSRQQLAAARAAWQKADRGPRPEELAEAAAAVAAATGRLDRVTAGATAEERRRADAELQFERAGLRKAEDEFARVEKLAAVSDLDREAARAARDRARHRVRAAQAVADDLARGGTPEQIAEARGERDRAAARHALLVAGTRAEDKAAAYAAVGEAEARLAEAEAAVREATVVAPDRCVVETVAVRPGDLVPAGQPVVRVLRTEDVWVKVFVPATDLGRLRVGQAVTVTGDADPARRFPGTVAHVAAVSEFTPRNVQSLDERRHQVFAVKVTVADPDGVFKSGMAADVFLPTEGR